MSGNSFGTIFKITTFGESHGVGVGVVIDGCPSGLAISEGEIQIELDRRKPGQSKITSQRQENDRVKIISGVFEGKTLGSPILLLVYNQDSKSEDYLPFKDIYRPGQADYTYQMKYGIRDWRGGGRASGRETLARVAAGAIAKKYLKEKLGIEILSYVEQVGDIKAELDQNLVTRELIESNIIRCPDTKIAFKMVDLIDKVKEDGDSIGGVVRGLIRNTPVGLGEPVFDKLSADLAKGIMSIGAVKGFDMGVGFNGVELRGSQYNDEMVAFKTKIQANTNRSGGTLGGVSNGETIYFRVAVKPTPSINLEQNTVNVNRQNVKLNISGRNDPCILPRIVPVIEAMSALVIMDHYLRYKSQI